MNFCATNRLEQWTPGSITLFVGHVRGMLGAGSTKNHVLQLLVLERERRSPPLATLLRELVKVTSEEYAFQGVASHVDYKDREDAVVNVMAMRSRPLRLAAFVMLTMGVRLADLRRQKAMTFTLGRRTTDGIVVRFWILLSKNHRATGKKTLIRLSRERFAGGGLENILADLEQFFKTPFAFSEVEHLDLTVEVRRHCPDPRIRAEVTPGSLRRLFLRTVIQSFTVGEVTDWASVLQLTGRANKDTLMAYYTVE